ncbi:SOUL family heme-binding protein [Vreelandella utahensis]|uniref:SOUL family heme-binding protein n=1 Tax=Vreelandella halophila TaxID=86177 RepID=UPI001C4DF490|nr:heme-binding protein [Halomonas utahensis]
MGITQTFRLLALLCLGAFLSGCAMFVEQPSYEIVRKDGDFELRDYGSAIVAETRVDASLEEAGGQAFDRLFGYISGENRVEASISMTSPVTQTAASEEIEMTAPVEQWQTDSGWAVAFVMPSSYTLETLPEPTNPKVTLKTVPARRVAVIEYSGTWSEKRFQRHLDELEEWIAQERLKIAGQPVWARYNPPFTPWFLRHNEIMIPVQK